MFIWIAVVVFFIGGVPHDVSTEFNFTTAFESKAVCQAADEQLRDQLAEHVKANLEDLSEDVDADGADTFEIVSTRCDER